MQFRSLGETPDAVLDAVARHASTWARDTSGGQITVSQLSEWIHDTICSSVQVPIEGLRTVGQHAVETLQRIAKEMGRSDVPSQEDLELLLRDLPRFELAVPPHAINIGHRKFWGESLLRSRIRVNLREGIGSHLKEELHLYGMALSLWSEQIVRKLEALVNSYSDAYRVQLHHMSGVSGKAIDPDQLEADLDLLVHWNSATTSDLEAQRA